MDHIRRVLITGTLSLVLLAAGVGHFVAPQPFVDIVPSALPAKLELVWFTGVCELAGAVGIWIPRLRRVAGWALVVFFIAVLPANLNMALNEIVPTGTQPLPTWALWARIPGQLVLIWMAWWHTRPPATAEDRAPTPPR